VSPFHDPPLSQRLDAKSVVIVILNWNSADDTLAAVESVLEMDYPNFRVLVVDNGSTDDSLATLAGMRDCRVEFIKSTENLGFTGGCNLGFRWALENGADYVWLLNSDAVTAVSTLSSLVTMAEADPTIGLLSPMIASLQQPSRFIYAGGFYDAQLPGCNITRDVETGHRWVKENSTSVILLGTALLIRVDLIRKIGELDDVFFAYWEDIDFSLRSNEAGFRNAVDFNSTVSHSEKFPTDRPQDIKPHFWYYTARNEILFWRKHADLTGRLRPLWWAYQLQLKHLNLLNGAEAPRRAILSGIWDGWRNRGGRYHADSKMPRLIAHVVKMHSRRISR
jgi:GT2 family glycosyltransferase